MSCSVGTASTSASLSSEESDDADLSEDLSSPSSSDESSSSASDDSSVYTCTTLWSSSTSTSIEAESESIVQTLSLPKEPVLYRQSQLTILESCLLVMQFILRQDNLNNLTRSV